MRISFDLDDTLVPTTVEFPVERRGLWSMLLARVFPERIRDGAPGLLKELRARGHELWVYTTSSRSTWYIRWWFRSLGVPLDGVVQAEKHRRVMKKSFPELSHLSKYPPAFDIQLHIDDSIGVETEGRENGFEVQVISPIDDGWGAIVEAAVLIASGSLRAGERRCG